MGPTHEHSIGNAQWSGGRKLAKLSYGHFWILTFISSVENIKFTIFEENSLQKSKIFYGKFYQFFLTCLIYVVKMVIFAHILTKRAQGGAYLVNVGMAIEASFCKI